MAAIETAIRHGLLRGLGVMRPHEERTRARVAASYRCPSRGSAGSLLFRSAVYTSTDTQAVIAKQLGCTESAICWWIRGASRPGQRNRVAIQRLFGIPASAWDAPPSLYAEHVRVYEEEQ